MLYLGIDQHSKQLTVNVRNEAGEVVSRKQVSTKGAAPREFLTQLAISAGESGQHLGAITKQGSSLARFLLGQLVMHASLFGK